MWTREIGEYRIESCFSECAVGRRCVQVDNWEAGKGGGGGWLMFRCYFLKIKARKGRKLVCDNVVRRCVK